MAKFIIYQTLVRLWGKGRFSSWDGPSFDHVKSLGAGYVWYTGIIRHATGKPFVKGNPGSPYSISDYYDVNPYLADVPEDRIHEFESLVRRTHEAGLGVIIDFVPNHVACDYEDSHGGIPVFDHCDYDWTDTVKIDYSHPETWGKMYDILRFWASKGIDGFRCDMVELVSPEFFGWAIRKLKEDYPGLVFIAEVYEKGNYSRYLEQASFDYLYDKSGLYDNLRSLMAGKNTARSITWNWQWLGERQGRMLNFLENHDEQRLASPFFAGGPERGYAALTVASMFNNAPFMLYFGQEVGENASESDNGRTSIFNFTAPESLAELHASIHGESALSTRRAAILERYRKTLGKAVFPAFSEGLCYDLCYCNESSEGFCPDRIFSFLRSDRKELHLVTCNFSDEEVSLSVSVPEEAFRYMGFSRSTEIFRIHIPPQDSAVMEI